MLALLVSCGNKSKPKDSTDSQDSTNTTQNIESNYPTDSLKGEYIGGFGTNTIIIALNYINGKKSSGYSILKGLRRNITGEITNQGKYFDFVLSEPGGDPYDGTFTFKIDTATRTMEGSWAPFDSASVKPKNYKLNRRVYAHEEIKGYVGKWYLSSMEVKFNQDKSGNAKGYWWNEKTESTENVDIAFSWFEEKNDVTIEWGKNNIFLSPKMKFKYSKVDGEEMLQSGDYVMYRY